jgi:hypothetical protein
MHADMSTVDPQTFADAEAEIFADAISSTYAEPHLQ